MNALTRLDWIGLAVRALLWLVYAVWADRAIFVSSTTLLALVFV